MTIDPQQLANEIIAGNRRSLARAITLIESTRPDHQARADALLTLLMPRTGAALRIGLTGAPGVGKSTFIEAIGETIIERGHRLAVLAVDPSSTLSGGSILGDKTRMGGLMQRPEAFIRPSPSGGALGGVNRRSFETLLLCEAAGFDIVIIETVGVGQSETRVRDITDLFLLLLAPGGGDELQGLKRGIVELADLILVNKAEGAQAALAGQTAADYASALQLLRPRTGRWPVPVLTCSALRKEGVKEAWQAIGEFRARLAQLGGITERRAQQARGWMWNEINDRLIARFRADDAIRSLAANLEAQVMRGLVPAPVASERLLAAYFGRNDEEVSS